MLLEQLNDAKFREQIVEEATQRVLARLSFEIDISQALQSIKELQDAIDRLGKSGIINALHFPVSEDCHHPSFTVG